MDLYLLLKMLVNFFLKVLQVTSDLKNSRTNWQLNKLPDNITNKEKPESFFKKIYRNTKRKAHITRKEAANY